jgi:hypothetical protein
MLWKSCLGRRSLGDYYRSSADLITLFIHVAPDYDEYTGKSVGIKNRKEYGRAATACEEWTSVRTFKPAISNDL